MEFVVNIVGIVQARMGSTRLPGKVLELIGERSLIETLMERLSASRRLDRIVLATSIDGANDPLCEKVTSMGHRVYRGSEKDVLERFYLASKEAGAKTVVRITGDCPLVDPALVDEVIDLYTTAGVDYASNVLPASYPDGLDVEVFSFSALEKAHNEATRPEQREHVTPFIRDSDCFTKANLACEKDLSGHRWTVDESEDLYVVRAIFEHFYPRRDFSWRDVQDLQQRQPDIFSANRQITRNQGAVLGTGQKLWKRAKKVIPGGNMLLSKRAEMFLPDQWPAYFSKAKGCRVWDLDDREYIDMSIMGIGTNILGYGHPEVDDAVRGVIDKCNMSTFNCPEEVYLAERLVGMHPWADMARFARSGGEANAIAIRIARAASGREKVAICGYHGWHDWYLSANLGDEENLAGHLLPGLDPRGVPSNLRGTVLPFHYNNFDELEALVTKHPDLGVIKMEVSRDKGPENAFLEKVRQLATDKNIVLVFDECTSGFRQTFGGLHKHYGVEPDMAMFGKAMGNGYAITAVIGRRSIMQAAQSTFISSTFWTERIGPTAALKTLEVMERSRSWEAIARTGQGIGERWKIMAQKYGLPIAIGGLPALINFSFPVENALKYKTLITQEMLKKGYLASNIVFSCIEHTPEIVDGYFDALDPIFALIRECEDGRSVDALLDGPVCHAGFKRLT